MKRTIWRPLLLGAILGALAGAAMAAGLSILTAGVTQNAIGIYSTLLLLAAALGGPVAAVVSTTSFITIVNLYGPADVQAVLSDPVVLWSNIIVVSALMVIIGIGYRLIFERFKMPVRLLPWAAIVIAYYVINPLIMINIQFFLNDEEGVISAILYTYGTYIGQTIFDIVTTSLIFIALPASYSRPLWYEPKRISKPRSEIQVE